MNDLRTAAQQALDYLNAPSEKLWPVFTLTHIIDDLRAALAEPVLVQGELPPRYVARSPIQAEPVAYWIPKAEQFCFASPTGRPFAKAWEPLYTAPPQRKPLTDDQLDDIVVAARRGNLYDLRIAIERAYGIGGSDE